MRYLSFDIECCDGEHICEFGYVIFDDKFNILDKKNFLINPKHKFNLIGRKGSRDITLYYSEEEYQNSPEFSEYYSKIKQIFQTTDQTIIGFSTRSDIDFLANACKLYSKEPIRFNFFDFQVLYCAYRKVNNRLSIQKIIKDLNIEGLVWHKSDDDALAVVFALKKISEMENLPSVQETLTFLKTISKIYKKQRYTEKAKSNTLRLLAGNKEAQTKYIKILIAKLEKENNATKNNRLKVCVGANYQKFYFSEFIALIEELYKHNFAYTAKTSECDIFVKFDHFVNGELCKDIRYERAINSNTLEDGNIKILSLFEFLQSLKLSRKMLVAQRKLVKDVEVRKRKEMKYAKDTENRVVYSLGNSQSTIGDLYGDVLSKYIEQNCQD